MAFNAIVAKLFWFVEVTGSNANNVKAWHETFCGEDAWTFTTREWTKLDNLPNEKIVEKGTQADENLCGLAKRKCVIWRLVRRSSWSISVVVLEYTLPHLPRTSVLEEQRNPLESRLIGVGICHRFWELSETAVGLLISSSIPGCSAKDSGSDLLWHSPQVWVFVKSVILLGSSASCFGSLYATRVFIGERLFGSSASKSNHLVGSRIGLRLGSFVGSLIGCCNQVQFLTWTWFPATKLRLVNVFAWLAERTSANSTKNFERAGIAFNPLLIIAFQIIFLNAVSFCFACVTEQRHGYDKLWECWLLVARHSALQMERGRALMIGYLTRAKNGSIELNYYK